MSQPWQLRPVRAADAAAIARHRYWRGEPATDLDAYAAWLPARIERGRYVGFVAEVPAGIVGGAGAVLLDWGPTRGESTGLRGRIVNVYTQPDWRRQGIARALVTATMARCAEAGVRVFGLAATDGAAPLYEALGFAHSHGEMILRR